jgi:hypothetical protein
MSTFVPFAPRSKVLLGAAALLAMLGATQPIVAQPTQPPPGGDDAAKKAEEQKPKTVEEVLKDSDRIDGLFTLYRDRKTGQLRFLLQREQLDKPFLYFTYTENGVPAAGQSRRCCASAATTIASS